MGIVVLEGGGPFVANDVLDASLLQSVGGPIAVLPTADAFENPDDLIESANQWARRLALDIVVCSVYTRADAREGHHAEAIRSAKAVVLAGDSSIHLRSTLLNTPVWEAIEAQGETGIVIGVGNCASALCDPMIDQRGGALGLGLGLVDDLTVMPESECVAPEQRLRTIALASMTLAELPTGSALVREGGIWKRFGDVTVHGDVVITNFR
jgi:cyanophycinase